MESISKLYKIGRGPSSSHTMGPYNASLKFKNKNKEATSFKVTLYGSLASTGKGHLTDKVIYDAFEGTKIEVIFNKDLTYSYHPNGMYFEAFKDNALLDSWLVFSVGGGSLKNHLESRETSSDDIYDLNTMNSIIEYCENNKIDIIDYILKCEGNDIISYMETILEAMLKSVNTGLFTSGILPGGLNVERRAAAFYQKYLKTLDKETLVYAASLAVCEENASGGLIVTAPTCGASGVVPGVIFAEMIHEKRTKEELIKGLLVGGLVGNIVKTNGSISGAEVGCQGEVGVACAMAASIITYLKKGSLKEIEYAAEIGLEHHLGLTCDPVLGLVQIPCIERNAISAIQAYSCANYAILQEGMHQISFDEVIKVMKQTGIDLNENYRETSKGGLAINRRGICNEK